VVLPTVLPTVLVAGPVLTTDTTNELLQRLRDALGDMVQGSSCCRGQLGIEIEPGRLLAAAKVLCNHETLAFRQLVDLCGMDYLEYGQADWETSDTATSGGFSRGVESYIHTPQQDRNGQDACPQRFAVVYHLLSHQHNRRLRVRVRLDGEPPRVPSVAEVWPAANWYEREAFDLYGILFDGHPDLRRLLTDYGFIGHPFRKDFPLIGEVEMRYDPEKQRVVYEPVSIEPRTLVPRVIRHSARQGGEGPQGQEEGTDA